MPVYKFWDLGIDDEMVIGCFQFYGKEIRTIDCIYWSDNGLDYYVNIVKDKWYWLDNMWFPHDIKVREQTNNGKSREDYLTAMWVDVNIVPNNPIEDGINAVKMIFNKIWFDKNPWVDKLIEALNIYRKKRDEKNLVYGKPIHDWSSNFADMFRYMAIWYENLINSKEKIPQQTVQRLNAWTWWLTGQSDPRSEWLKKMWISVK